MNGREGLGGPLEPLRAHRSHPPAPEAHATTCWLRIRGLQQFREQGVAAPSLALILQGELCLRQLSLQQAALLLHAAAALRAPALPWRETRLQRLTEEALEAPEPVAAAALLAASAQIHGAEAPRQLRSLLLQLVPTAIQGEVASLTPSLM